MTTDTISKVCSNCKLELPIDQFNYKLKSKGTRASRCRECTHEYYQGHYNENKKQYMERNRATKRRNRERVLSMKDAPCTDCGGTFPRHVMEFDHLDPSVKEFSIGRAGWSWYKKIEKELEKCEIVCANCHKIRTHNRKYEDQGINP